MERAIHIGVGGVSRVAKAGYIGVNGVARKFTGDAFGVKQIIINANAEGRYSFTALYPDTDGNYQEIDSNDLTENRLVSIRTPSKVYVISAMQKHDAILDVNSNVIQATKYFELSYDVECTLYQF